MSNGKRILQGSVLNVLNLIVQVGLGLLIMPYMIRAFGDQIFGIWSLVGTFMGYYGLLDLGFASAVNRFISRAIGQNNHQDIRHVTSTAFFSLLVISLLTILLTVLIYFIAPLLLNSSADLKLFRILLIILSINMLVSMPVFVFEGLLISHYRYDLINILKIISAVFRAVFTIILIRLQYGVLAIAGMTVLLNVIEGVLKVVYAYRVDPTLEIKLGYFQWGKVKEILGYSIYNFIGRVADLLRYNISSILITIFIGVAAITHYRVASRLVEYFLQGMIATTSVLMPYFSQKEGGGDFQAIRDKFYFATKLNVFAAIFIGFTLIAYGKFFIERWVGRDYGDSYIILVILVVPMTCALVQNATFPLLYGISKHRFLAVMNCIEGVLNLVFSLILVKHFGLMGIALGSAIPMMVSKVIIQPVYLSRVLKISWWEYCIEVMAKPILFSLVSLVVPLILSFNFLQASYFNLFIFISLQGFVFLVLVYLKGLTHNEKLLLQRLLPGVG